MKYWKDVDLVFIRPVGVGTPYTIKAIESILGPGTEPIQGTPHEHPWHSRWKQIQNSGFDLTDKFVITQVRNPWTWALSLYHQEQHAIAIKQWWVKDFTLRTFPEWLHHHYTHSTKLQHADNWYDPSIDVTIRLEHRAEDLEPIWYHLSEEPRPDLMPECWENFSYDYHHPSWYTDPIMEQQVQHLFKDDFRLFYPGLENV